MNTLPKEKSPDLMIGRVGRTYGIKGWVKIHSFTDPKIQFLEYSTKFILLKNKQILLSDSKQQGAFLIGKITGYESPEEAKNLVNLPIFINSIQLPTLKKNEYYWTDLINLEVYNLQKKYLGKIESLFETGANDVMVVNNTERKIMIPYAINLYIKNINLETKEMVVDWHEDWL